MSWDGTTGLFQQLDQAADEHREEQALASSKDTVDEDNRRADGFLPRGVRGTAEPTEAPPEQRRLVRVETVLSNFPVSNRENVEIGQVGHDWSWRG